MALIAEELRLRVQGTLRRPAVGTRAYAALIALPLAIGGGVVVAHAPLPALVAGLAVLGAAAALALGRRVERAFLGALALLLAGYAFLGRGFAYIGVGPGYVGELVLVLAAAATVAALSRARVYAFHAFLLLFMVWGASRTLPYLEAYGLDALRDGVVWAYGLIAIAVAFTVRPHHVDAVISWYARAIPIFLVWVPPAILIATLFARLTGDVGFVKPGDMGVHLSGVGAFVLLGLYAARRGSGAAEVLLWPLWLLGVAVVGIFNRGGLLAASVTGAALPFVNAPGRWLRPLLTAVLALGLLLLVNPELEVPGAQRKVSMDQLFANVASILGDEQQGNLQGTKEWRLQWWNQIIGYTIEGPYFWSGKGFGINLAEDDGFAGQFRGLRSPHNGHLTILARAGVPGLLLWVTVLALFATTVAGAALRARRRGDEFRSQVLIWVLVYWAAMLVNASFDVYLEGPQAGIWFWSLMGFGIAVARDERLSGTPAAELRTTGPTPGRRARLARSRA